MRSTLLVLLLTLPALGLGQSLGEVAKKEKERREQNKKEGKKALVFSEKEIFGEDQDAEAAAAETVAEAPSRGSGADERTASELVNEREEGQVPTSIPPDLPLDRKLVMFERMKAHYESQAQQIDEEIAKNEVRIRELDSEIRAAATSGGAGLPVAPSADAVNRQFTGQESVALVAEQTRLEAMNDQLRQQKERLKLNLQEQGRVAGIPPGYLRF